MKSTLAFALAAVALAAPGLGGTADAAAPTPATRILLTVTSEATGDVTEVYLGCRPTGGNHPVAETACDELQLANGDFDQLAGNADKACPMIYDPVTVTAVGTFNKVPVDWKKTFGNGCELNAKTGHVFAF
ncbi:SSI family serine proteinase inhibitor [Streptomyces sp. P9(2023)]|uniref:SSI family serine proteinase inhibitor n=1 Tax=Streptomyces sp. P9(2023) TaxID=3064394 RepID=UPI0028F42BFB|nr:SSI family serine proteinase inhibitor [Streptomyces sp. P9(2023)]MDT9690548.1 SSI family serine proteinase inhibitor [Streptomyces sp. P9(2023)]